MGPAFWWAVFVGSIAWWALRLFEKNRARAVSKSLSARAPSARATLAPPTKPTATASRPVAPVIAFRTAAPSLAAIPMSPSTPSAAEHPVSVSMRSSALAPAVTPIPPPPAVHWVGEHETVSVAGMIVRGGLFYMGDLRASPSFSEEPSVIDPTLPISASSTYASWTASYWPRYSTCTPTDRRSLLTWMAEGRKDPQAPIGLVFLYFYGLERRLLQDAAESGAVRAEVPRLIAEIDRLRRLYDNRSFRQYACELRELAIALYGEPSRLREFAGCKPGQPSSALRVALGRRVADNKPLTPPLAFAWACSLNEAPRSSSLACVADEIASLFEQRYIGQFGEGLVVPPPKRKLIIEHRGAAFNRISMRLLLDVPDMTAVSAPQRPLSVLLDTCAADLQALAKARRRDPIEPLEIAVALPAELNSPTALDALSALKAFADSTLKEQPAVVTGVRELFAAAALDSSEKPRKRECLLVAAALERLGFGMEPDVRWMGPTLTLAGQVAIYRCGESVPRTPTPAYRMAQLFLHMAVAVASADGRIDDVELEHARGHINTLAGLESAERARLRAHLVWLGTMKPSLSKLLTQLKAMSADGRRTLADAAVGVAAADGRVDAGEIRALEKIYRALGLSVSDVAADVHRTLTGSSLARAPQSGIDAATLARKMAETADVQNLLSSIFANEEAAPTLADSFDGKCVAPAPTATHQTRDEESDIDGLDAAHASLMRRLLNQDGDLVKRTRIDEWCLELELMAEGALESVNEAAYQLVGDALFDVEDDLLMHADVREQLKGILEGAVA